MSAQKLITRKSSKHPFGTTENNGKPWKYVMIPHNAVLANMGLANLISKYEHHVK